MRQAVSLLNSISMGFGPMSMGADSGAWRRAVRSPRYLRNFVCPKIVEDDDVVALERGRDRKRFSLRTAGSHSRLQVRWRGANLLLCGWTNYLIRKR